MILESHFWKDDLLRKAAAIRRCMTQKRWTEASYARLEQTLMLGFYSIRKLTEARKLPSHVVDRDVAVTIYPAVGKDVHMMNWWYFWELYDMERPEDGTRSLMFLCHQFVHSYVFHAFWEEDESLGGVLVASDRERAKRLYHINLETVIGLFESVGNDTASSCWGGYSTHMTFNESRRDYDITYVPRQTGAS